MSSRLLSSAASPGSESSQGWEAPVAPASLKRKGRSKPRTSSSSSTTLSHETHHQDGGSSAGCPESEVITWPDCVTDVVRQRVEQFKPPKGYDIATRPKKATSLVWFAGANLVNLESQAQSWVCLADDDCAGSPHLREFSGAFSNWTDHLRKKHGLSNKPERAAGKAEVKKSPSEVAKKQGKQDASDRLTETTISSKLHMFNMGIDRYLTFIFLCICPESCLPIYDMDMTGIFTLQGRGS